MDRWGERRAPRPLSCDEGQAGMWVRWGDWGELSPQVLREAVGLGGGRSERGQGPVVKRQSVGLVSSDSPSAQVSPLVWGQVGSPFIYFLGTSCVPGLGWRPGTGTGD